MNPLQFELDRLYGLGSSAGGAPSPAAQAQRPQGVRALVLELLLPAGWPQLSSVWTGVQADLGLPPPGIAVSGVDGLQLWFSFAVPIPPLGGERFLQGLRARYLPDVALAQVRLVTQAVDLQPAPPVERSPDKWSAFVAPDLASVFSDTPWLDIPPSAEGQTTLLRSLASIQRVAFEAASSRLGVIEGVERREAPDMNPAAPAATQDHEHGSADAVRFLKGVMHDEAAPLALRIEAAKALLLRAHGA